MDGLRSRSSNPVALGAAAVALLIATSARAQDGSAGPSAAASAGASAAADALARRALAVLEVHCARCHGGPAVGKSADRGGFDHVLEPGKLIADGLVVRFAPADSELYQRVRDGEMPPAEVTARPGPDELATLEQWIAAGAPAPRPDDAATRRASFLSRRDTERAMAADIARLPRSARRHVRYIGITHMHNAGRSAAELDLARRAIAKLVNSLTWSRRIVVPVAVDRDRTVYRVDLRGLGWSRELWETIVTRDPYAVLRSTREARTVYAATGTSVPYVRADWLVSAASRPPLYHHILALPDRVAELERHLGVDSRRAIARGRAIRAGFTRSGVSRHNRVIERHDLAGGGYYWRSYDFKSSDGRRNIFDHPLGPGGADSFTPDGGEIIFSLPNGLQAYLLIDEDGRRIDKAPTQVVVDPSRRDSAVENGISCMGCHSLGIIEKRDEIRAHLIANRTAFDQRNPRTVPRALALYRARDRQEAVFAHDRARFEAALARAVTADGGGAASGSGDASAGGGVGGAGDVEPIDYLDRVFDRELDLAAAAAELDLEVTELRSRLSRSGVLRRNLGALLVAGGTVKRDVFVSMFATAAAELGLGRPLADLPAEQRLAQVCEDGSGADCFEVGNRFASGRGIAVDFPRAAALYRRSCDRDFGAGCTALGVLVQNGRGVRQSDTRAAQLFDRSCQLGDLSGCQRLGAALLAGRGVARDGTRAAELFSRACGGGHQPSCKALADLLFTGKAGVARNRRRAVQLYQGSCQAGFAGACLQVARVYGDGEGIIRENENRAAYFFSKACDLGDARSCTRAGELYYEGDDVSRQRGLAARLFAKGCDAGDGEACYELGKQHSSGKGVRKDKARARQLFDRACNLGKRRACLRR